MSLGRCSGAYRNFQKRLHLLSTLSGIRSLCGLPLIEPGGRTESAKGVTAARFDSLEPDRCVPAG